MSIPSALALLACSSVSLSQDDSCIVWWFLHCRITLLVGEAMPLMSPVSLLPWSTCRSAFGNPLSLR